MSARYRLAAGRPFASADEPGIGIDRARTRGGAEGVHVGAIEVRRIRAHELTEDRAREQQCDVSMDHASAFRLAASTRSISSAVMTSGGR